MLLMTLCASSQVPNSSPTAASASSDMYGAAVLDACEQIKARLSHLSKEMPEAPFANVCGLDLVKRFCLFDISFWTSVNELTTLKNFAP